MKIALFTALSLATLSAAASTQAANRLAPPLPPPQASRPAPTTATPTPASISSASTANDYRLAGGDKLRIEVYKDTQLSQSLQVRPDGKVTLPLIGDIPAAGRTAVELRDAIAGALKEYITNPVVTVIVVEASPQVVYITGEVTKPGALPLMNGRMSVLQALAMAGGFTDFANKKDVRILRKGAKGMQTLKFNYKEAIDDGNSREPLQLQAGDTVIVK
ncbi:MAG: polysaccharide biosynthesis/export family protein [Vicinamibacterales bacterium]